VINRVVLEVDGSVHRHTKREKDTYLFNKGYIPLHILGEFDEKELLYLIKENNKGRMVKSKPQESLSFLPKEVK